MKSDIENVVDLRRYRERRIRARRRFSTQSNIVPVQPLFVTVWAPFLVPIRIPVMWFPWHAAPDVD